MSHGVETKMGRAGSMMRGTQSGWRTYEGGSARNPCRVCRGPVMAGRRPWSRLDCWTTRPLASRRCSQAIYTPRWSACGRRMWSCEGKTRHVWMTVQLGRRREWGP